MRAGVDECEGKGAIRVWQQQRCRYLLSLSLSLVAGTAAWRLHVGMANAQSAVVRLMLWGRSRER